MSVYDAPLDDALEAIVKPYDVDIEIDRRALFNMGISTETPVTIDARRQSLEVALDLALLPLGLVAFVDGEVLFVTSEAAEEGNLTPVEYDARDAIRMFGDLASAVKAIESLVWPRTWSQVGGPGQVLALPDGATLSIDHRYAVHAGLHRLFALVSAAASASMGTTAGDARTRDESHAGAETAANPILFGSPDGREIVKALASPIKRTWNDATLLQFAQDLRDDYHIPVHVDQKRLNEAGIEPAKAPLVRWRSQHGTLEAALRAVLKPAGLAWTIHQGNLWITSKSQYESDWSLLELAAYRTSPALTIAAAKKLGATVERVLPTLWDAVGGQGHWEVGQGVLFVHQTSEVQREVERRFRGHLSRIGPQAILFPKSERMRTALRTTTTLSFRGDPLHAVLDSIARRHDLEIQVNARALTDAGIGVDTPITYNLKEQPLGRALDLLLQPLDLRFLVNGEVLFVTSATVAAKTLTAIEYDAGEALRLFGDAEALTKAIESLVQPTTWSRVRGAGQIVILPGGKKLSIDQSYSGHADLHEFFALVSGAAKP